MVMSLSGTLLATFDQWQGMLLLDHDKSSQ